MKDFFLSKSRSSTNKFLEGLNKWFFCQKKKEGQFILFERTRLKRTTRKKAKQQWSRTKTVSQKAMNK